MFTGLRAIGQGLRSFQQNGYPYIWSNLAFVALSLPIITAPAAFSALVWVGYLAQTDPSEADLAAFWQTFRANLWRALPWGVFNTLFAFVNFYNLFAYSSLDGAVITLLEAVWVAGAIVWAGLLLYTWPIYYEMAEPTVLGAMRNALVMVIRNPLFTLVIVLIIALLAIMSTILVASWLLITWGAISAIANAAVLNRLKQFRTVQQP
ncbi:MAG: hypothetical protein HY866_07390 [Chloroflexi bacterium]|nr:hypothetical protein [Chloroflexota bacterium]